MAQFKISENPEEFLKAALSYAFKNSSGLQPIEAFSGTEIFLKVPLRSIFKNISGL